MRFSKPILLLSLLLLITLFSKGSNIEQPLSVTAGTDTCATCAVAPSIKGFGTMVGGLIGNVIATQFSPPGGASSGSFVNSPVTMPGYVRNLGVYNTTTAANGSVARLAHMPNTGGFGQSAVEPHGISVFSGQAQGSYQDTVTFTRLETGDYYNARQFREGTTATDTFGGWSTEFLPDAGSPAPFFGQLIGTVAAGDTIWFGIVGASSNTTTEGNVGMPVPFSMTLSRFCVTISTAQPGTGSLVLTVRDSGANTALEITIPAGGPIGMYCDLTNTASLTGGTDWTTIQAVNNAPAAGSGNIQGWSIGHAAATGTMWAVCGTRDVGFANGTTNYWTLLTSQTGTTETTQTSPWPLTNSATATNFFVYIGTAGGAGSNTVFTMRENLAGSTMTLTAAGAVSGIRTGSGTLTLTRAETLSLEIAQSGGVASGTIGGFCFSIAAT
jgi:hypothetical protein